MLHYSRLYFWKCHQKCLKESLKVNDCVFFVKKHHWILLCDVPPPYTVTRSVSFADPGMAIYIYICITLQHRHKLQNSEIIIFWSKTAKNQRGCLEVCSCEIKELRRQHLLMPLGGIATLDQQSWPVWSQCRHLPPTKLELHNSWRCFCANLQPPV